ncbi:MAG: hypothetical protein ACI8RD_003305 [Bacillariaceae sp.]|jgi:hypothetical protein
MLQLRYFYISLYYVLMLIDDESTHHYHVLSFPKAILEPGRMTIHNPR